MKDIIDIEGKKWRTLDSRIITCVDIQRRQFRLRHIDCDNYEVSVDFDYATKNGLGKSLILSVPTVDKEFWTLVRGALIHTILKESN